MTAMDTNKNNLTNACSSTIYKLSVLLCRCRSTLQQNEQLINCDWSGR